MRRLVAILVFLAAAALVAGCGTAAVTAEAPVDEGAAAGSSAETYVSAVLTTDHEGALAASGQLALGTLLLTETDEAVTPDQATALLPLWQALQGGVTAETEVNAVLKQIERTMTETQLLSIAAMTLTQDDLRSWTEEHGMGLIGRQPGDEGEVSPEVRATRQAQSEGGQGGFAFGQGPEGGDMPPEMATVRAQFEDMTDEEREALRATMQAGGGFGRGAEGGAPPGDAGGFRGGSRQYTLLLRPLIEMLDEVSRS